MYLTVRTLSIFRAIALCLLFLFGVKEEGYGQRVYADTQQSGTTGTGASVTNPTYSVNINNLSDYTKLTASTALVVSGSSWQQLTFSTRTFSANSTVFVKINVASSLLGGGITAQTYAGSNANTVGTLVASQSAFFTSVDGITYLAVTGSSGFNAVRITLSPPALLGTSTADIYYAFYEPTNRACAEVLGTSSGGTGISLGGGVTNPLNAVDNNLNTYSSLNGGILGIGYTISQTAYFSNVSNAGDAATITFSLPPSLLQLSLFNNVNINLYNGNTLVNSGTIGSLLSLDLLGLLRSGQRYTVSYVPGNVAFDRIEVSVATGVSLLSDFRIHEIQRTPAKPNVPKVYPLAEAVCYGSTTLLTATSANSGSILRWYNQVNDGSLLLEGNQYTTPPITVSVGDTALFYVAAAWSSGCPAESERVKIAVIANPLPTITLSNSLDICSGEASTLLPYTNTTNNPSQYSIIWNDSPTGFNNVTDAILPLDNITLSIPVNTTAGTYIGTLRVKNVTTGCESALMPFSVIVHAKPSTPNLNITTNSQY